MINVIGANAETKALINKVYETAVCFLGAEASDIDLSFIGAQRIKELNREFRSVDKVTDVLSFPTIDKLKLPLNTDDYPYDTDYDTGRVQLGSIVICKTQLQKQAKEYGHSEVREAAYLTLHGILHLLGYDHIVDIDKTKMREMEECILGKLDIRRE